METFLDEIWGATHYHVKRSCAGYFDSLLPASSAIEELLELFRRESSTVHLMRGKDRRTGSDSYRLVDGSLDLVRIRNDFADGYTIILGGVERFLRAIASLAHSIEAELNFPIQVNAYITAPASQGLIPHYDDHDIFILQIQGSKTWHLYDGPDVPPHELQPEKNKTVAIDGLPLLTDLCLEVGDVLYVPRGRVHAAETNSEPSAHLTVGLHPPTALTLATAALNSQRFHDDRLNAYLPPRYLDDADVQATLGVLLRDAVKTVEDPSAITRALDGLADALVRRGRCPPIGPISNAVGIDGQTLVRKYQPLYSRVKAVAVGSTVFCQPSQQRLGRPIIEPSLAWLLQPLSVETFLNEIWAEKHYHGKRYCVGYFDDLLPGPSAVEDLLELFRQDPARVRLIREHDKKSRDNYRLGDGTLDLTQVRSDFVDGYTIVLDDVEQYVRAIASLAHAIEIELNFATKVNAYITPPESQGFVAHYDGHDVLILQIQGSKIWHLYDDIDVPPHQLRREEKWVAAEGLSRSTDVRLEVGDVLYLPRGLVHAAEATSEPSVHLTVGIHAPTALTFAVAALNSLSFSDDRLNARLPPRHLDDADALATLGVLLRDAVRAVEEPCAVAGGLDALADILVRRGQCPPVGRVSNALVIDGQTVVRKYQPLYSRVTAVDGGVTLQFAQLSIPASSDHEAAMLFISGSTEPFRVCDLPGLRPAQRTELARTLIVSGFLVRCPTTDVDDRPR